MVKGNTEEIVPILLAAKSASKYYDDVVYVDGNGTAFTSGGLKIKVTDREYYIQAMAGNAHTTDPLFSRSTGNLVCNIAIPIKSSGKVIGVVFGSVDMKEFSETVQQRKAGQTGYAYVVQSDGLIVVYPNKEFVMKVNSVTDNQFSSDVKAVNARIAKGETGIESYEYQGKERYVAFTPLAGTKLRLAINVPKDEVYGAVSALTTITLITIVCVLIVASFLIALYARRLAKPIQELELAADRVASGDLSEINLGITSNDEIGRLAHSFEKMTHNLRTIIQKVSNATTQVAASSEQLTASADQSSQAAGQVAASITDVAEGANQQMTVAAETASVINRIVDSIRQIAENTDQVASHSAEATDKAKQGDVAIEKAVVQMRQIETTVNSSAQVVIKLGERSKEIGNIVDTISGIAGQTNLLALNAAIEAARAGEQGRGFAVVAEEVRKLAEQSQEAAKQIAALIGEIQTDTDKAVVAMNDGTREVKNGAAVVGTAGTAFKEIASLVSEVSNQVMEISAAMRQMTVESRQIVESVKKIDEVSKHSAGEAQSVSAAAEEQLASMEEIAASSQALARLAEELQQSVAGFKV